jgi:hypothetical protein
LLLVAVKQRQDQVSLFSQLPGIWLLFCSTALSMLFLALQAGPLA